MIVHTPILVLCNDGTYKQFSSNELGDAKLYAQENHGILYHRDDWYNQKVNQLKVIKAELEHTKDNLYRVLSK